MLTNPNCRSILYPPFLHRNQLEPCPLEELRIEIQIFCCEQNSMVVAVLSFMGFLKPPLDDLTASVCQIVPGLCLNCHNPIPTSIQSSNSPKTVLWPWIHLIAQVMKI